MEAAAASAASVGGSAGSHQAAAPPSSEVDLDTYDVTVTYSHCEAPVCSASWTLDDMVRVLRSMVVALTGVVDCGGGRRTGGASCNLAICISVAMTFQKLANFRSCSAGSGEIES